MKGVKVLFLDFSHQFHFQKVKGSMDVEDAGHLQKKKSTAYQGPVTQSYMFSIQVLSLE